MTLEEFVAGLPQSTGRRRDGRRRDRARGDEPIEGRVHVWDLHPWARRIWEGKPRIPKPGARFNPDDSDVEDDEAPMPEDERQAILDSVVEDIWAIRNHVGSSVD